MTRNSPLEIYCIAVGGTGMAPLACLLQSLGHRVRGADGPLYPPMSDLLANAGIEPHVGYDPAHLSPAPDLVIVGNAVPRSNVEATYVEENGLPRISMPEALGRFLLADRKPLVVAGTHGKTTTTAMASWVLRACGRDPGYLIGGVPCGMKTSFAIGQGHRFVIEGDEYNAAYFDRGPKFLHYRPHTLILTSVEYDHADLYPSPESLLDAYRSLVALVPPDGLVVACGDDPQMRDIVRAARCRVRFYGLEPSNDIAPVDAVVDTDSGCHWSMTEANGETVEVQLALPGDHNVANALGVWAAVSHDDVPTADIAAALGSFAGVKRRLETIGTCRDIIVVDDFAHHPTAVEASLSALRRRHPERRILALFEPRSLTAGRAFLHERYRQAFRHAHAVRLAPIFHHARLGDDERLDLETLVADLRSDGVDIQPCQSVDAVLTAAQTWLQPGDLAVTMSSGSFDRLPHRLLAAIDA